MKWSIFVCSLVCLARFCEGGALRCPPGATECIEKKEITDIKESSHPGFSGSATECLAGTEWESKCHTCRCSDAGIAQCLKREDCVQDIDEEPSLCKPNTTFLRDCNKCLCLENGLALCSMEYCADIPQVEDVDKTDPTNYSGQTNLVVPNITLSRKVRGYPSEPTKACQPGQEFRMDCNKCLCDNEGRDFSCTRIDCNAFTRNDRTKRDVTNVVAMTCVAGSVFERDCNVCRCTESGNSAFCTVNKCVTFSPEKSTESETDFRCNPGEQFKRDCNDCTCSADGKSVFCTLRLCGNPGLESADLF